MRMRYGVTIALRKCLVPLVMFISLATISTTASAAASDWKLAVGASFFKWSAGKPNELGYNAVSDRWERIAQDPAHYAVSDYEALEPLYFNMSFGVDAFIRYRRYLLLKLAYDYSNPLGIGGQGHIAYTDKTTEVVTTETKEFSFTSHQLSYYIGPVLPIAGAEVYLAFTPMGPTWVNYREKYTMTQNGTAVRAYDMHWHGFFGNCRALLGIQVPVTDRFKIGSEATFVFMNYITLTSGNIEDHSFAFPFMRWTVTARYEVF